MKRRALFSEKINKTDKPLARLTKMNRERTHIKEIKNERGEIKTDITEIKKIIRE